MLRIIEVASEPAVSRMGRIDSLCIGQQIGCAANTDRQLMRAVANELFVARGTYLHDVVVVAVTLACQECRAAPGARFTH